MNSISADLNLMIRASEKASKAIIRDFGESEKLQVSVKAPMDFVSSADTKAEQIIIDELSKSKKKYSFLSEEKGIQINENKNILWIIDPIDGTVNFLHGIPHFAISIALKSYNEIIAGVIYDPIKNEIFYAEKNNGAYFNNQRIRVSKKKNLQDCLFASGGKSAEKIETSEDIAIRKSGSAALDMAYVASGRFDGYFQKNLNIWDIAAGIIILKEAGGIINDINISKHSDIKIIASNNSINEKLVKNLINF